MPFDQLLADYFAQLAFVPTLFSAEAGGDITYVGQSLRQIVPNVESDGLLADDYEARLAAISAETDSVMSRRNAILDLLLSFYALQLGPQVHSSSDPQWLAARAAAEIEAKRALLRRAADATRARGRGFDYLRQSGRRARAGAETLSRIELGLLDSERAVDVSDLPARRRTLTPVENSDDASFGRLLSREDWASVEGIFREVDDDDEDEANYDLAFDADDRSPLAGERVAAELLAGMRQSDAYRIGATGKADELLLVCRNSAGRWWLIAEFDSERDARRAMRRLRGAARAHEGPHLHLVEWILLRDAMAPQDPNPCRYNFRITAVLPAQGDHGMTPPGRARPKICRQYAGPHHARLPVSRSPRPSPVRTPAAGLEARAARWPSRRARGGLPPPRAFPDQAIAGTPRSRCAGCPGGAAVAARTPNPPAAAQPEAPLQPPTPADAPTLPLEACRNRILLRHCLPAPRRASPPQPDRIHHPAGGRCSMRS